MPIQLVFDLRSSTAAVENVLNHGNKISSLTAHDDVDRTLLMCRLLTSSRPSVKRLSIYSKKLNGWIVKKQTVREIWKEFPSLQELFVYRCTITIDQLTAPNLIYLALEHSIRPGCYSPIHFRYAPRLSFIGNPPHRQLVHLPGPNSRSLPSFPSTPPQHRVGVR